MSSTALIVDGLGAQPRGEHAVGDRPEVDAHAARRDRDQLGRHEVGEHEERRRRWRLLDRLEQPRRGLGGQEVEVVEHDDLAGAFDRGERRDVDDLAGLLGGDGGAGALDLVHVRVLALQGEAGVALLRARRRR